MGKSERVGLVPELKRIVVSPTVVETHELGNTLNPRSFAIRRIEKYQERELHHELAPTLVRKFRVKKRPQFRISKRAKMARHRRYACWRSLPERLCQARCVLPKPATKLVEVHRELRI